jgi:hypothetical protein
MPKKPTATRKKKDGRTGAAWARAKGYKSGLEERVAEELAFLGITDCYETLTIPFLQPEKSRTYTPDFILPNGIIVETKGLFTIEDRQKHNWVKEQHPNLDIRFVFTNPRSKIRKGSKTTYADWCDKFGYEYARQSIPVEWITQERNTKEPQKDGRKHKEGRRGGVKAK